MERKNDKLDTEEKVQLKHLIGQMMWVVSQIRSDISYGTCLMNNMGNHPSIKILHEAKKAMSKLKSEETALKFPIKNPEIFWCNMLAYKICLSWVLLFFIQVGRRTWHQSAVNLKSWIEQY